MVQEVRQSRQHSEASVSSEGTRTPSQDKNIPQDGYKADGGKQAWIFLASVSVLFQLTMGFTISFGAFREYYFDNSDYAGNQTVSIIGTVGTGVIQMMCPFLVYFLGGRAWLRRVLLYAGTATVFAASLGAAFSYTPTQLILTQGVLYGLGSGMVFAPSMSLIDEWFIQRRSFAYGIYFATSSVAAAVIPPVLRSLLASYGSKATLVGWGIFVGVLMNIALLGVRSRLPESASETQEKSNTLSGNVSYGFLKKPLFWLVMFSNVLQASAQYLPSVYIPSFATEVTGASPQAAAALLTIYNIASAVCQPLIGIFADRKGVLWPLLMCTLTPAVAVLCVWGFAKSYGLVAFAGILFGGLAGGYVVLRNKFATAVVGDLEHPGEELTISAMFMFVRGCAAIGAGFVGVAVSNVGADEPLDIGAYGAGKWLPLILTIGLLTASSSIGALGFVGKRRHNVLYAAGDEKQQSTPSVETAA